MKINSFLMSTLLVAAFTGSSIGQVTTPAAVVRSFYAYDRAAPQTFNRRNLDSRKKWLSPRLYDLFREELRKEEDHLKKYPTDKPFFGDGFPFRPLEESCDVDGRSYTRSYRVAAVKPGRRARVDIPVRFFYPRPCTVAPVVYKVRLVKNGISWLIDDVVFDDGLTLTSAMRDHRY